MATIDNYKIIMSVVGEDAIKGAANAVKGLAGAIAGVATLQFAQSVLTLADDMSDLADSVGLSMTAVTGFSYAVAQAGGTAEGAGKGIIKFYKALGEAGEDQSSKAAEALRKVGIGLDDIKTKSEGQLLGQALEELGKMGAGAQQTALMLELFGKSMAGVTPGTLLEILKSTDAEGFAQGLAKVKDASDKMGAAMFKFKVAAAEALGSAMPLLDGLISIIGVVGKHLDKLAIAMGAVFGAAMLANIGKITTAMRAFAASNPFTLIAVAVGTLVVAVAELIDTYGSFGNAMKAVGNIGINLINTLVNAYKSYGLFMGNLFEGIGKAILAGLNPFSNKTAMGELQAGLQRGLAAVEKQMAAKGPISFKFDVKPVAKKPGKSALAALLEDEGVVNKNATGLTEQQANNRQKEALAAQQVTTQMKLQNEEANKLRQKAIDLIGLESDYANLLKSNAQIESDSRKQIADLDAKIVAERAKGKDTNAAVIVELEKQKTLVEKQLQDVLKLNQAEYQRQIYLKDISLQLQNGATYANLMGEKIFNQEKLKALELYGDELTRFNGKLQHLTTLASNMQGIVNNVFANLAKQIPANELESFNQKFNDYANLLSETIADEAAGAQVAEDRYTRLDQLYNNLIQGRTEGQRLEIENLLTAFRIEKERYQIGVKYVDDVLKKQNEIQQSYVKGAESQIANIAKQFEPYKMGQDAIALGWRKVSDALNTFIDTGKFSFKDFARSVLLDLTKMIAQAMVFKYIFTPIMGAFGLTPRANGGPVSSNEPYLVGEKGPELFVPKSAGSIIPNNKLPTAQATGTGMVNAPVTNNYITNNINALDSRSVAQVFAENRKTLLGTVQMAQREMPYGV